MSKAIIENGQEEQLFSEWVKPREDGKGVIVNPDISYENWSKSVQACGNAWRVFSKRQEDIEFILGDLYLAGEKYFPHQFEQMLDNCVIDYKRLTRVLWVCKKFAPEQRHTDLSITHHEVVAGVKDAKKRDELLTEAAEKKQTVAELTERRKKECPTERDIKPSKKPSKKAANPAPIDVQDESALLQHGHEIIAYLEAEEGKLPFRKWPAKRLDLWNPILATMTKIARRSIIRTHL